MEEGDLLRFKGPRTPNRASYVPRDGAIVLLGLSGAGPSEAHSAYISFLPLEVKQTSGDVVSDPIGRLLPDMVVKNPEHDTEDPIGAVPFLTAFLANITALSSEDAYNLRRSPEAQSVRLELNTDPAFMLFRWESNGVEHFARFEHPSPLGDLLGEDPPAFQRTTTFRFPLLFAVARMFTGVSFRSATKVSPSGTGNPAGLSEDPSAPESEKAPDLPGSGASTRFQFCNGALKRSHTNGPNTIPETSVTERERQAPKRDGQRSTSRQKALSYVKRSRRAYSAPAHST